MSATRYSMLDGNEAVARIAFKTSEIVAIYPITPASSMGELADAWAAAGRTNRWGVVPRVVAMQSEAGAAGAVHGALQAGALTTTFTASQGLLLMIPNMYKIAGELTPAVFHVAARTLATHALSIFGDHSDVMAVRQTGFALLSSSGVQEAQDLALVAHAATLKSRIPFVHFFDGFRTSHEVAKIAVVGDDAIAAMIDDAAIDRHRAASLSPERPVVRGTAQNPDVFFQSREAANRYYTACPDIVQATMDQLADLGGRRYGLFDYHGAEDAERVVVVMGSAAETARATVDALQAAGEKVGVVTVRLYRPFATRRFLAALPPTVKAVAVLDRTKEPGSPGEPLYLDCVGALAEARAEAPDARPQWPRVVGGRYGLSSKEFTPAMVRAVFDNLGGDAPKNHFTVGIRDDVEGHSLEVDASFSVETDDVKRCLFYGLGSDGTVGANKNSIAIIGDNTDLYAQGYFVYDSKKSGATTISHLRFGPRPIQAPYLIGQADFIGCHQPLFLASLPLAERLKPNGIFLLNAPWDPDEIWDHLPRPTQERLLAANARVYVIDASRVAADCGMGKRINTVMQICFFALSGVLPRDQALAAVRESIRKTYGKKGPAIVEMNLRAVDSALDHLYEAPIAGREPGEVALLPAISEQAPEFAATVLGPITEGRGDELPVSRFPPDGTYPPATAQWEKRNLASEIPTWDPDVCIQCGKCAMVCPHAVVRIKVYEPGLLADAPPTFKAAEPRDRDWQGRKYTIQIAPEDCTGCAICVDVCPAKNKSQPRFKALNMEPQGPLREPERLNWDFFLSLPDRSAHEVKLGTISQQQALRPLFEFSGACAGCGETPYIKLATQLFGDRMIVANATGCSSIYGGNLPTTPWAVDADGRGPAWANSLFEDNAEFGLGILVACEQRADIAVDRLRRFTPLVGDELVAALLSAPQRDAADIHEQRQRVAQLKERLAGETGDDAARLLTDADALVRRSVWIVGGDGWAYDIGFGGLDHVLASGRNVNVLVLDTEVYSNTGGQMSKATPRGAVAKFAAGGKRSAKKDLGLLAMNYGNVYVAGVAMGARDERTLRAFIEAEAYPGPSLIIAYSHCIAHGIHMTAGMKNQKAAVDSGQWILYRYNPERARTGDNPLVLDSGPPTIRVADYFAMENRFTMLTKSDPDAAKTLLRQAQADVDDRVARYRSMAEQPAGGQEPWTSQPTT